MNALSLKVEQLSALVTEKDETQDTQLADLNERLGESTGAMTFECLRRTLARKYKDKKERTILANLSMRKIATRK